MSITVSGLGSGLDYNTWIEKLVAIKQTEINKVSTNISTIQKKETLLSTLEDNYKNLLASVKKFTDVLSTDDIFNQKAVTSSSDAITALVSSSASAQSLNINVSQLATSTIAKSASTAASYVDATTTLSSVSEGAIKAGTFSIYVNGTKPSIEITTDETLQNTLDNLNNITGVSATLSNDGRLTITSSDPGNYTVNVGSSSDTSNFANVMSLTRNIDTGVYSSSKSIFKTSTSSALTSTSFANGTVTAGTFTIGNTLFTIGTSTTLNDIIKKINSSNCGATAAWDSNAGKLVLTAQDQGASNINITAGDGTIGDTDASNFTDIMGLTTSTWDGGTGNLASTKLTTNSQTLGTNAILTINGTQITSSSNKVTSDISGINGLTLTLNEKTTSTATISISQDSTKITEALTELVNNYNTTITATDNAINKDGILNGENILKTLRNSLRISITSSVTGEDGYKSLANLGITTGDFSTDTKANTTSLKIDTEKLSKALTDNPDAVKTLLIGDGTPTSKGILTKLEPLLENSTDTVKGYFTKREDTYEKDIDRLNDKKSDMTTALEKYKKTLETKFQLMDTFISSMESSASIFDSYFNTNNKSSK